MGYDDGSDGDWTEEIQGAPPAVSGSELREQRLTETISINRYMYRQIQQLEHMLLSAPDLQSLLEVLLVSLPRHFSFPVTELWLHDPEDSIEELLDNAHRYGRTLQLKSDVFDIQELYDLDPDITLIDATDSRMFEVLKSVHGINSALLMPLLDSGRLVGSLHWGLEDGALARDEANRELIAHLGSIISICLSNAITRQQLTRLSLLDPLTEISNRRGFEVEISREIARSHREQLPLSLLILEIDEYTDLCEFHGRSTCEVVVRKVADRIAADLRTTDRVARLSGSRMAILVPGNGEVLAGEVAERIRHDVENFPIDSGRGAVMQATLSVGLATWEPQRYPAVDLHQLARQLESAAGKGLDAARSRGGNHVSISRLSTLMV